MVVFAEMLAHLSALLPVLSSWETCALNIIEKHQPSTASFICKTSQHCPSNGLYKQMRAPTQTLFGLENDQLPEFQENDLVFLVVHEDNISKWKNETVQKYLWGGKNSFKIVVVASMRAVQDDIKFMGELFAGMWKSGIANGAVLLKNDTTSQLFTYIPYRSFNACEDTSPVMVGTCNEVADTIFNDTFKVVNLNSCPLTVSMTLDKPWLELMPFRGPLKPLLDEVRSKMNFSLKIISPARGGNGGVCHPDELTGTKGDVASGKAHIAFGTFNRRECSVMKYIHIPYTTCLSWCIPLMKAKGQNFTFLSGIFRPKVWAAYAATVFVMVLALMGLSHWTKNCLASRHIFHIVLVVFSPMPSEYRSSHIRVVLAFWLCASLVLRTAYEGELKSQSAVPLAPLVIRDLNGIVSRVRSKKFKNVWATTSSLGSLSAMDGPSIRYLYEQAQVCPQEDLYYNIVQAALKRDRAIFTTDQRCRAIDAELRNHNGPPRLNPQTGGCAKMIQMSMFLTARGSPFRRRIARIQRWTFDTGLFLKWTERRLPPVKAAQGGFRAVRVRQVRPALNVLFLGCACGSVIFLLEIVAHLKLLARLKSILRKILLRCQGRTVKAEPVPGARNDN